MKLATTVTATAACLPQYEHTVPPPSWGRCPGTPAFMKRQLPTWSADRSTCRASSQTTSEEEVMGVHAGVYEFEPRATLLRESSGDLA